jgi:ribulose-phosphate 3-epimerase
MIEIAPSILSADFARLAEALATIEEGGADVVHVDVMDGHFVPNLTIGPPVVAAIRSATGLALDCHLMMDEPDLWVERFVHAGAARVTVQEEACVHLHRTVHAIKSAGAHAGVAINPATPVGALEEILPDLDVVLVMSVNPGFGGQSFIPSSLDKVRRLVHLAEARRAEPLIQVDGGVDPETIGPLVAAGARSFVAGNAVFGRPDSVEAIRALRQAAEAAA